MSLLSQPCFLCGSMTRAGAWCEACEYLLPYFTTPHCPVCALPSPLGERCGQCLKQRPYFDSTYCCFSYQFPADKLIQHFKYHEQLSLAPYFAQKMYLKDQVSADYLIPLPLHPNKLRARGFNQTQLLCQYLSENTKIPYLKQSCTRQRDTASQSLLPFDERHKNVANAFSCNQDLMGKHVILVDDVMTTGATLNALAKVVKEQGASTVACWVLARTISHQAI